MKTSKLNLTFTIMTTNKRTETNMVELYDKYFVKRELDSYTDEEIKRLYNSPILFLVSEYFKALKLRCWHQTAEPLNLSTVMDGIGEKDIPNLTEQEFYRLLYGRKDWNSMRIAKLQYIIKQTVPMRKEVKALQICNDVLHWCTGYCEIYEHTYNPDTQIPPEELYAKLHEKDEVDKQYGRATRSEVYDFIWQTARHLDTRTLDKLLRKSKIGNAHRPKNNRKIYKYDKQGCLIDTFANRDECIEKDGIKKNMLSMVLTGRRKTYKGYSYVEDKEEKSEKVN